jgi:hypothetical protein
MKLLFTKILKGGGVFGIMMAVLPLAASAQVVASGTRLTTWITKAYQLVRWLPPFLVSIAVLLLIWNVIRFVIMGDGGKKKDALQDIAWSFFGLVFVLSIWGLLAFVSGTLGLGIGGNINSNFVPGVTVPEPTF